MHWSSWSVPTSIISISQSSLSYWCGRKTQPIKYIKVFVCTCISKGRHSGVYYIHSYSRLQKYSTRAELRVVLVMKLAEDEVRVSGNDTTERESGWSAAAPDVPCRALRAWISRRSTKASKCSRSCGETRPRTSESRENYRGGVQGRDTIWERAEKMKQMWVRGG